MLKNERVMNRFVKSHKNGEPPPFKGRNSEV